MFGPLPRVHRIVVGVVVVALGLAGAVVVAWYLPVEVVATTAAGVGLLVGLPLALLLVQAPPTRSGRRASSRDPQRR